MLQPEFDYANGRQTFRNYLARNTVEVRLDDIDRVGLAIDAAATGGATASAGSDFDVRNRAALERDALRQAVADARARADAAAAGANATIDRVHAGHRGRCALRTATADDADGRAGRRARCRDADRAVTIEIQSRVTFDGVAALMALPKGAVPLLRAMTTEDMGRARGVLMRRDPVLAPLIKKYGACGIRPAVRTTSFAGWSRRSCRSSCQRVQRPPLGRIRALLPNGTPTPKPCSSSDEALRGAGLSGQKLGYMRDLSLKVLDGTINSAGLQDMSDDAIVAELTKIKGIGRWTVEMLLIFRLTRRGVFPAGDLGIVKAAGRPTTCERSLTSNDCRRSPNGGGRIGRWRPGNCGRAWKIRKSKVESRK